MRIIPLENFNSETIMLSEDKGIEYRPLEIFMVIMRTPSNPHGINFEQMANAVNVINALKAAKQNNSKEVLLEEAEYKTLCDTLKAHNWPSIDPVVYDWMQKVFKAEKREVTVNAKPKKKG